jgi:hypothetical protein
MASYIGKFKRNVIGSEGRISDYIPKIIAKGDFKRINDLQVILNSWNNILMTPKGSYLLDPDMAVTFINIYLNLLILKL